MSIRLLQSIVFAALLVVSMSAIPAPGVHSPLRESHSFEFLFSENSAAVGFENAQLDGIVCRARNLVGATAIVVGHADKGEANVERLSEQRARNVQYVLSHLGLAPDEFVLEGKGARQPVDVGNVDRNRRVEVEVIGRQDRTSVAECGSAWKGLFGDDVLSGWLREAKSQVRNGVIAAHVPAVVAVAIGRMDVLDRLLSGPDKIRLDKRDRVALVHAAVVGGDKRFLGRLESFGIKSREFGNKSLPIIWASCDVDHMKVSEARQVEIVQKLLAWGAKADGVSQSQGHEISALQCAAKRNRMMLAELLVKNGSNPDEPKSEPPIFSGHLYPEMVWKLVDIGAAATIRSKQGATLFHMLLLSSPEEVQRLVDLGLDVNAKLDARNAEWLFDTGFRVACPTDGELTPLHIAVSYASRDVLDAYLHHGAAIDQGDSSMVSNAWDNLEGLAWLVDNGIHLGNAVSTGIAIRAARSGTRGIPLMESLWRRGVSLRESDSRGLSPVSHAITAFSPEMVRRLVELGALDQPCEYAMALDFAQKLEIRVRPESWNDGYEKEELRLNTKDLLDVRQRAKDEIIDTLRAADDKKTDSVRCCI